MDMVESGRNFFSIFLEFMGHGFEALFFFLVGGFEFFNCRDQSFGFSLGFDDVVDFVLGKSKIDEFVVSLGESV